MTDTDRQGGSFERSERDREVAEELVEQAKAEGLDLIGLDGVLTGLTKQVLEPGWRPSSPSISRTPST